MDAKFPVIKTERLLLRRFTQADIHNVFKGLSHPDVIRYYGVSFTTLAGTQEQMDWFSGLEKSGTGLWWAVCSADNEVFYGAGGLNDVSEGHIKAEIGFWLLPDFWRSGIMSEAVPLICRYGFETMRLQCIEAFVEGPNVNCRRALHKLGFRETDLQQEFKDGRPIDLHTYIKANDLIP